jgi:hypothetical protein
MDIDDPPDTRGRGRLWAGVAIAVVAVVATMVFVILRIMEPDQPVAPKACSRPAGAAATEALSAVQTTAGLECVGLITEHDYPFGSTDTKVNAVISRIVAENLRVRDQEAGGKPYVRIAVFMPMTSAPNGAMSAGEVLHALQGAYAAQFEANSGRSSALRDPTPLFQLVLANEGTDHSAGQAVVDQLGALKDGPHPLVAVTGMSISVPETRAAGERLSEKGIPSIGAVITADDMVAPAMFKVSPSNQQYTAALKAYLGEQPQLDNGFLVWDRNAADNYVQKLKSAFLTEFGTAYQLVDHNRGFTGSKPPYPGTAQLFSDIVDDICAVNPELVFYSGRDRDLPAFIEAIGERGRCQQKKSPIVIVTGATGLTLAKDKLDAAIVGVVNASSTDSAGWARNIPGTPPAYAAFRKLFTTKAPQGLGFTDADLASGYAIMHRDAVVAAVWSARLAAAAKPEANAGGAAALPTAEDVRDTLFSSAAKTIPAASGSIYFREEPKNDLWPIGKPVPVTRVGAVTQKWPVKPAWTTSLVPVN